MPRLAQQHLDGGKTDESHAATSIPLKARRHRLIAEIENGLRGCGVIKDHEGRKIRRIPAVIGVSGGADSMALLIGFAVIASRAMKRGLRLCPIAVHVHHHLRDAADDDAAWVEGICRRWGIECEVVHIRPGRSRGNLYANARALRYDALLRAAKKHDARFIAVAHHGEDQLETMLMALARGAGLTGLAGMPWSRELADGVNLIRPLLATSKSDCMDLCKAAGIRWREDESNRDAVKARARLRRDVMPVLEELWPGAVRRVTATADALAQAVEAWEGTRVRHGFGEAASTRWSREALRELSVPAISAGLRRAALHIAPQVSDALGQRLLLQAARMIQASDRKPRRWHWPCGLTLHVAAKHVELTQDQIASLSREADCRRVRRKGKADDFAPA